MDNALLFKDKPVFGLDIGFSSLKAMEIGWHNKRPVVTGYGFEGFSPAAIRDGIITNPELLAQATYNLFAKNLVGDITTRRVALSIPATRAYNRNIQLPKLSHKELDEAIRLEAEQYIPIPLDELYLDYDIVSKTDSGTEVLVVAAPRKLIDSYLLFSKLVGLEVVAIETTISASSRLFVHTSRGTIPPTILIDFGSISSDITIYDQTLVVTGTAPGGGDSFTTLIAQRLGITLEEAGVVKTKYGLGVSKKQAEITEALTPILESLTKEIRRMIRYYEERSSANRKIAQAVTLGGGANMPGLSEYLTDKLRLPVRVCHPWEELHFGDLQPPNTVEKSMYITVAGLSLMRPKEIFV
jgi:type IV pilus assembly protein PilM